ncbi:hypothetical protein RJ641_027471, partial [Dillenia turbinata]
MPSFPPPGSVTICEINRELITADSLSEDRAKSTYGKVLGLVFSPVPFQSLGGTVDENGEELQQGQREESDYGTTTALSALRSLFSNSLKGFFHPNHVSLLPEVDLQGVSWHQHKHILAFISGQHQVIVRDYEDAETKDPCVLSNESQRSVKLIEWRPNGGRVLSVACRGGICIWAASYPGNAAAVRSGVVSFSGTLSRGSGVRWTLVDFLRTQNDEQVSALSWSPNGRYPYLLYAAFNSKILKLEILMRHGRGTPIRRGLGGISILKWSPTGDYFFSAKFSKYLLMADDNSDGTFYLWETNTWTSEPWSSTSGFVTAASWDPDGRMILVAFSKATALGSIHFASKPPSLDAHLLPVDLPEIVSLTESDGIDKIAWDASGERLALSYKGGDELYRGLVAIYDVRRTPLISASLIGFIRGPGDNPKPIAFSFHDKFKQGPLLSVCWNSGFCCTYPLIFRS